MCETYEERVWEAEKRYGPQVLSPMCPPFRLVPKNRFYRAVASAVRTTWAEREQIMAERNAKRRKAFDGTKGFVHAGWAL